MNKLKKSRNYDPVIGKYYDNTKEEEYQDYLKKSEIDHGKNIDSHLPPSYQHREPLILDHTKEYSPILKAYDIKNANAKKRYQMKYMIEDEYAKRNNEFD